MRYLIVYPQEGKALSHEAVASLDVRTAASLWSGLDGAELIVFDVRDGDVEILRLHNHGRRIGAADAIKLVRYHHALYLAEAV